VRLSQRQGGYQITVFTAPTPFRAGPVDVSVLVQDAATGEALPQAQVTVWAGPRGRRGAAVSCAATSEAATNKLLHAALFELPGPGWWEVEVIVQGPRGSGQVRFAVEAAEPSPRWLAFWPWVSWPVLVILLFSVHQLLRWRASRRRGFAASLPFRPGLAAYPRSSPARKSTSPSGNRGTPGEPKVK
jgi:hypothetical protein